MYNIYIYYIIYISIYYIYYACDYVSTASVHTSGMYKMTFILQDDQHATTKNKDWTPLHATSLRSCAKRQHKEKASSI